MGSSKQSTTSSQQQQQQSQTQPYAPTIPLLGQDVSAVQSLFPNYQPTGAETMALSGLASNATSFPSFAQPATNITSSFLGGDPSGLLRPALNAYNSAINPIATASLDPTQNPAIASALDTVRNDVTNSVNGMFAGAGRDLSGANTQTLARGISQGEAPILLNQYNQNVANAQNAAGGLLGAAGSTASAMGGNQGQGFNFSSALPSIINQPQLQQLAAAAAARGLPIQNLAQLEALTLPIAGLGSQSSGTASATGQSDTTSSQSPFSMIMSGLSLFGKGGPFGY